MYYCLILVTLSILNSATFIKLDNQLPTSIDLSSYELSINSNLNQKHYSKLQIHDGIPVFGRNIKINALHPGVVWTPMVGGGDEGNEDLKKFFELETPLREVGFPKNMADAILFLCTTEYLTGSDLNVDGGRLADGAMGSNAT